MKAHAIAASLVLLGAGGMPAGASSQESTQDIKPYRTLVYDVSYGVMPAAATPPPQSRIDMPDAPERPSGSPRARFSPPPSPASLEIGTLTFVVAAAAGAGGSIVDVSYRSKSANEPPIRVALAADGTMVWDRQRTLNRQALLLLPLLARGTIDHDFTAGESWASPARSPLAGNVSFKVLGVAGTIANLAIAYTLTSPIETGTATATYDTFHVCPTKYDLHAHAPGTERANGEVHLIARLSSDSLSGIKQP
jgi:hypothetical protein